MTTKVLIVLAIIVTAIVLFFLVGFDVIHTTKFNLVAIGLGFWATGDALHKFWSQP